jgi:hypothetical protein
MQSNKTSGSIAALALVGVSLMSTVGCMGHTTLGEDEGNGGTAGSGGAGSGYGGGTAGGDSGGNGGAAPITCPASTGFDDGRLLGLGKGPQNQGLLAPRIFNEAVFNYQDNIVFEGALKAGSAFEHAGGTGLGPESGAELEPFLGQVELVPPACAGTDVSGRTLTVTYLVRLTGAVGTFPGHGAFLGSAHDGDFTFYEDARTNENIVNTLAERTLEHTFTEAEAADVAENGVFFNLYTLEPLPIDLYIDQIVWD